MESTINLRIDKVMPRAGENDLKPHKTGQTSSD